MPTPKQVRFHYGRLKKLRWKFSEALIEAHNAGVINYDSNAHHLSPCRAFSETWDRIILTTEKQLAQAMREEIAEQDTK